MHTSHITAHDLELLESFVHDCVQQLPKLPTGSTPQVPTRCTAYHTSCSNMLKQVLGVLELVSPRLCQLLAQIWDLTSLNFFVLIQLTHTALATRDTVQARWNHVERFFEESVTQHTKRVNKYEGELEAMRVDACELRAELQKTRQKQNRFAVENAQLRRAINGLMDADEQLGEVLGQSTIDRIIGGENMVAIDDSEERELFGVAREDVATIEKVHPLESHAQDFDQLFRGLYETEHKQVTLLNEMDRLMNSNVVALLWRHGPDEEKGKRLNQLINTKTTATQTEQDELDELDAEYGRGGEFSYGDDEPNDVVSTTTENQPRPHSARGGSREGSRASTSSQASIDGNSASPAIVALTNGDTTLDTTWVGAAPVVTRQRVIPPSLRAQLTTRPRVQRVLEKQDLSVLVLRLWLEKIDADGTQTRRRLPRLGLHRYMKEYFMAHYGVAALAEFHMMELVKSCLYCHEKLELDKSEQQSLAILRASKRKSKSHGSASVSGSTNPSVSAPGSVESSSSFSLLPGFDLRSLAMDDLRIALFARLCELVPLQWPMAPLPAGGNLFAAVNNAMLDFLGDIIELDPAVPSSKDVLLRQLDDTTEATSASAHGSAATTQRHYQRSHSGAKAQSIVTRIPDRDWRCSSELARILLAHHLGFLDYTRMEIARRRFDQLLALLDIHPSEGAVAPSNLHAPPYHESINIHAADHPSLASASTWPQTIAVDALLLFFVTQWLEYDQQLTSKLHDAYRQHVATLASLALAATTAMASGNSEEAAAAAGALRAARVSPIEQLQSLWNNLPDESLSPRDVVELATAFHAILAVRRPQQDVARRRSNVRKSTLAPRGAIVGDSFTGLNAMPSALASSIGGVTEQEFVFQTQQVLRARRTSRGIRTNGCSVRHAQTAQRFGARGTELSEEEAVVPIAWKAIKPGMEELAWLPLGNLVHTNDSSG